MTRIEDMIQVMKAFEHGSQIECRFNDRSYCDDWTVITLPTWDWGKYDYRIRPEMKTAVPDTVGKSCMYAKFILVNYGKSFLRIEDIEYVDRGADDIIIYTKSGLKICPKTVHFYDENGNQFKIDTEFDDETRLDDAWAKVNVQLLTRLVYLAE